MIINMPFFSSIFSYFGQSTEEVKTDVEMLTETQPKQSQRTLKKRSTGKENGNYLDIGSESECDPDKKLDCKLSEHDAVIKDSSFENMVNSYDEKLELTTNKDVFAVIHEILNKVEHSLERKEESSEAILKGDENTATFQHNVTNVRPAASEANDDIDSGEIKTEPKNVLQNRDQSDSVNDDNKTALSKTMDHCKDIITKSMIDEEERFQAEIQASLDEVRERAQKELARTGKKQRYDRLQLLLDQSQLYATYILQRMKSRQKDDEKRQERLERLREKQKDKKGQASTRRGSRIRKPKKFADETNNNNTDKTSNQEEQDVKKTNGKRKVQAIEGKDKKTKRQRKGSTTSGGKKSDTEDDGIDDILLRVPEVRCVNGERIPDRQPVLLSGGVMRKYQLDGVDWLRGLFENGINGILADEMGLGKTIQSIALICALIENGVYGPYLIAAPLSTLPNWISEFKKFAPELYTILYHGNQKERAHIRRKMMRIKRYSYGLASLPVVVSSYEILMRDRPLLENYNIEWKYLIVDEGHRIKNLNCRLIKELKQYRCSNRLLLTGTPLQNNLSELWSLLNFLLPDIFDDLNSFQSWFDFSAIADNDNEKLIAQEQETKVLNTIHSVLTPFLLRRLKTDVDLTIPPKKEVLVYAPLTEKQQMFYKTTLDRTILDMISPKNVVEVKQELTPSGRPKRKSATVAKYKEENSDDEFDLDQLVRETEMQEKRKEEAEAALQQEKMSRKAIVNVRLQNIMMQLRKCCNHPYLLEYPFDPKTEELIIDERLVQCSGKMLMLDRMLPALQKLGHKILLFSQMTQMLDILGDYCRMRGFWYSRIDGAMSVQDRQQNIEKFRRDPETFIFLLSTRAGGLGLNLMMADTCIIYDSDWNPQVDLQAQDRCHRIGQTKPVVIYRLVTANTVDQKIIERAASKRKLEKMVIHKKNFKGRGFASAITPQELVELLESTDTDSSVNLANIITDEHLRQLLDRSDMVGWDKPKNLFSTTTVSVKSESKTNVPPNDCRELKVDHDLNATQGNMDVDSKSKPESSSMCYKVVAVSTDDNITF